MVKQYQEEPVDLKPYLNNSILSRMADVLYRSVFQPFFDFGEWISRLLTRHFCEKNIPPNERV